MIKILTLAAVLSAVSGCATILNEDVQQVNLVASNGQKFTAVVDGADVAGPGIIGLKREKVVKVITVSTPECASETTANPKVDSKFFINILSGGAFGSTTDYSTGKMWAYDETIEISCGS